MSVPSTIVPVTRPPHIPKLRRAKRAKFCADCAGRIPAGTVYLEWSAWRWTHLKACPDAASEVEP